MEEEFHCPLPEQVEALINIICNEQSQPPLTLTARLELASVGEVVALKILNKLGKLKIKSFSAYTIWMARESKKSQAASSSPTIPTASQLTSLSSVSPPSISHSQGSSSSPSTTLRRDRTPPSKSNKRRDGSFLSFLSDRVASIRLNLFNSSNLHKPTPEFQALEKLEFRRTFLVLSYLGGRKLEDVLSVGEIRSLVAECKHLTMGSFENLLWDRYGDRYCLRKDRIKYRNWDSPGQYYSYQCHVRLDGSYFFKGPYLDHRRTLLHEEFKEENVLIVKIVDEGNSQSKFSTPSFAAVEKIGRDGIYFGQKCFRFIAFKNSGRGEKDKMTGSVKCYFVNTDKFAASHGIDSQSIRQARSIFMHLDTLPSLSKYAARLELLLSKTITLPANLDDLDVEVIEDIPCQLADGSVVKGKDGKALVHTDGTGYISEDLVRGFVRKGFKENMFSNHQFEIYDVHGSELNELSSQSAELPLLMQFRLFYEGYAAKGTVLVNKELPEKTIQVRPSMIKVHKDRESPHSPTVNSFQVVATSARPKKSYLSKYLISLLHYGGVPTKFFTDILKNSIGDARSSLTNKRAAFQVALANGEMDDDFTVARMISSGIPLTEPYIQARLSFLTNYQNKSLKEGKLPIAESFYLMGTADPTGTLDEGEVCIIHENGQISGKVLVYRNPGIHFGDVHVLTAKHVDGLEETVGNSKYGIFFPTKGPRSLTDELAGGDLDGDLYWISRNPDLLKYFKPSDPWICMNQSSSSYQKKPADLSDEELEHELFSRFLSTRFQPSLAMGIASNNWLVHMDQLLTLGHDCVKERVCLKENMLKLVDIYYEALDAPKTGVKATVPRELVPGTYPHYMGKSPSSSYHSESVLGKIYDQALELWELKTSSKIQVWKLSLLDVEIPEMNLKTWQCLYKKYRDEMKEVYSIDDEEMKRETADKIMQTYKEILYEAADFETSPRSWEEICVDALAIYNVCYDYAMERDDANRCGFPWRVAGEPLIKMLIESQAENPLICLPSVLQEVLTKKTAQEPL